MQIYTKIVSLCSIPLFNIDFGKKLFNGMIANEKKTIGIQTLTPQIQKAENQDNSLRSDK